jgi:hypothetical protein
LQNQTLLRKINELSHQTSDTSLTASNIGDLPLPVHTSIGGDLEHLRVAYGTHPDLVSAKSKKQKKINLAPSPELVRHPVPEHKESKFFVQPGVKNVRSDLKLKTLKGFPVVSEKVEINIEASKFKESDSFLLRQTQTASPSKIGDHHI